MQVGIRFDTSDLERGVATAIRDDMPFVSVLALTQLAKNVRDDLKGDIATVFENPRPFTVNSPASRPARKRDTPVASEVFIKDRAGRGTPPAKYLRAQIVGGARRDKGLEAALQRRWLISEHEQMVPARGINLNRYGNVTGGLVRRVLQQLNGTMRARRRNQGYFWSDGSGKLPKGVAERRARGRVRMVFVAVDDANYTPHFNMYARVLFHANRNAAPAFRRAAQQVFNRRR